VGAAEPGIGGAMLAAVIYHSDHLELSEQFVEQVGYPVRGDANLPRKLSLTPALSTEPPQAARSACQPLVFPCASPTTSRFIGVQETITRRNIVTAKREKLDRIADLAEFLNMRHGAMDAASQRREQQMGTAARGDREAENSSLEAAAEQPTAPTLAELEALADDFERANMKGDYAGVEEEEGTIKRCPRAQGTGARRPSAGVL